MFSMARPNSSLRVALMVLREYPFFFVIVCVAVVSIIPPGEWDQSVAVHWLTQAMKFSTFPPLRSAMVWPCPQTVAKSTV